MSTNGNRLLRYAFGWGSGLWLIGYLLGIVLFAFVPAALIGWIITPIGVVITVWVLLRVKGEPLWFYAMLSAVWTLLAVILDYVFIVKAFNPSDGYYKADVYLYYALTFLLPVIIGWWTNVRTSASRSHTAAVQGRG